ncbi:ExbD/TolR family protein [Derxia gummosa]|uniref:ExbD/TolR family protein n=1 Tax=Derxia gummosa DSM 723 TaxID=1121388 RepID=A0A8B6X1F2_9BURK|nr:biopolymer transporter ExbD [Derxia gummosa]
MALDGFQSRGGAREPIAEINTTPLVDVLLVLLAMFIVAAPLLGASIPLDLPAVRGTQMPVAPTRVIITLDARGGTFWEGEAVDADEMDRRLAEAATRLPQPQLFINADRSCRYEQVAAVIGLARAAGLGRVSLLAVAQDAR